MGKSAIYFISIAARLANMHPTSLRKYERAGFLEPSRTKGKVRLYSDEDIRRLKQIRCLVEEWGTDMDGVGRALALTDKVHQLVDIVETEDDATQIRNAARAVLQDMLCLLGMRSTSAKAGNASR